MAEQQGRQVERTDRTLARGIRAWHVSLIALGGIIGSCYFLGLGGVYSDLGAGAVIISYVIAGVTIYGVMQSFAELLVNIPRRGSFVSYTREFMGDTASTGIGWSFWANWVAYVPSEALATGTFMGYFIDLGLGAWNIFVWGLVALALLTAINLYHVKWFGHVESIMAIAKILAVAMFGICTIFIFLGLMGPETNPFTNEPKGFIGSSIIMAGEEGMTPFEILFPSGSFVIITYMIWTLVNFQGSEIVGLSAAETQNPEKNVPAACKKVAVRIIIIYLIPVVLITLTYPYALASYEQTVFAELLGSYGLNWAAGLFVGVTLIAAFSCANSGFYGTVRSVYGLSVEGMAPKFLSKLNRFNVPYNATLFTIIPIWVVFIVGFCITELGFGGSAGASLYERLLCFSGFTGTLCWVGILWSQVIFRKRLKQRGYDANECLTVKAQLFPALAWISIIIQVAAMIFLVFEDWLVFVVALIAVFVPIAIYGVQKKRGKIRTVAVLGADEVTFDEKFPKKEWGRIEEEQK